MRTEWRVALLCCLLALAAPAAAQRRALTLDDLHRIHELTEPAFAPRGDSIAYTVSTHNLDSDATVSDIWLVSWRGSQPRPLTNTKFTSEWLPRWRPDGKSVAFLSDAAKDETTQIWLMPVDGGAARPLTQAKAGVSDFAWSPDGKRLVFLAEDDPPASGKDSRGEDKPPPPIVTTRFQFKEDGRDYLTDRRQHLYLLDVASGQATQLTRGDHDEWLPSWSPDGKLISFVSKRSGDADRNLDFDVFVIEPVAGAQPRRISDFAGTDVDPYWESRPQFSPDSRKLVWLQGGEDKWIYYAPWQLTVADLATGRITRPARIDRCFYKPRWSHDGKYVLALVEQSRTTWLARIDPASEQITYLTSGNRFGYDFDVAPDGRIVVLDGDDYTPYELSALDTGPCDSAIRSDELHDCKVRYLTRHNAFLAEVELRTLEDISVEVDGIRVDSLVVKPLGYRPDRRYPVLVSVHGGPVYQVSHEFMFDWQFYAANGYVVLGVNPRGSSGRGFDFARAISADWGKVDVRDVQASLDFIAQQGWVDATRAGVGGWSYGGILTNYLIASDTRFKAAVSGAGSANTLAMYGHDQYTRELELEIGTPWQNFDVYARLSYPFLKADRIRTPTMFQCAQMDFNVPCLGAEQMYQALRSLGVPTQLVLYPDENHGLTVPSYLRDRLQRNLAWYDRFLKPGDTAPAAR
ncbi:MAG TPA: S9 family peptidase [Steroidobacteraceae bacterium]|nr:S9 family peptidase [Steroidobacteraceae bacterium]